MLKIGEDSVLEKYVKYKIQKTTNNNFIFHDKNCDGKHNTKICKEFEDDLDGKKMIIYAWEGECNSFLVPKNVEYKSYYSKPEYTHKRHCTDLEYYTKMYCKDMNTVDIISKMIEYANVYKITWDTMDDAKVQPKTKKYIEI